MNTKPKYRWVNFGAIISTIVGGVGLIVTGLYYLKICSALNMASEHKIEPAKLDVIMPLFVNSYESLLVYCSALNVLLIILGGGILFKCKSNAS
jgi:hypothetical protein